MPVASSPSDYTTINVDYSTGNGYYTDKGAVSDLLQIAPFTSSTYPSEAQVGAIIKRIEGYIDEKVKRSFRPLIYKDEYHNFEFIRHPMQSYYGGYVGFIQLDVLKVKKIISLRVWQGNSYLELASAQAELSLLENYRDIYSIVLQLPNSGTEFELLAESSIGGQLANSEFNNAFGIKTTNDEIVSLVNEEFPSKTSHFTNATASKSLSSSSSNVSDFFYAFKDTENGSKILISSLLAGEDGSDCNIKVKTQQSISHTNTSTNLVVQDSSKLVVGMLIEDANNHIPANTTITAIVDSTNVTMSQAATNTGSSTGTFTATNLSIPTICTVSRFTDKEDVKRIGSFWKIGDEGRIFFLQNYPYHTQNSIIVSYIAGDGRVSSTIHEAATKLVAAEILRHDDQTILVAETGANISTKEKYDILKKEADDILKGKGDLVFLME
ncbi:adaptor protein [Poseidoniales virus YSH_150918]|uniref:Adaptor protein n=1 Tax=Poseidoniales virus YSH_150918 TaxID=3071324 RepID=A0A976YF91_9CAUD|nr:adaptor protein [Yangshan Harbor Poseidoniales virus]UVF62561.1 adaptor protein [Poseidoniales virus YSH_150918]